MLAVAARPESGYTEPAMGSSNKPVDPKKAPVPFKAKPPSGADIIHQTQEWVSGRQGGGKVPADFTWGTNPKQHQEERGSAELDAAPAKR